MPSGHHRAGPGKPYGHPSHEYFAVSFPLRAPLVSHVQLRPPPLGVGSLKARQRDDKDLYSSESFVRILSYVKGLSEHVSGSAEYSVSLSQ